MITVTAEKTMDTDLPLVGGNQGEAVDPNVANISAWTFIVPVIFTAGVIVYTIVMVAF